MKGKIEEIASRLGLSEGDVKAIRKERMKWPFMIGIISIILSLLVFLIGLILGIISKGEQTPISGWGGGGYPYAVTGLAVTRSSKQGLRRFHLPLLMLLGFLTGISQPVFGDEAIDYGVFSKKWRN